MHSILASIYPRFTRDVYGVFFFFFFFLFYYLCWHLFFTSNFFFESVKIGRNDSFSSSVLALASCPIHPSFFHPMFRGPSPLSGILRFEIFLFFFFSSVLIFLYLCICFRVYLFNTLFSHLSPVILLVGMVCRGIILCFYFD